ncbi:hypothetical protein ACMT1E_07000 [Sphingomonas flavalba]|uniref:hypothetical protein n=1 Tax=Sphingomonas flavalba TaxID=2559804 RepID=UPI0039E01750
MNDPVILATIAASSLAGLGLVATAALRGWRGWLDLKRMEIQHRAEATSPPTAGSRIEIADLKERIRKLEAIAAGVDL